MIDVHAETVLSLNNAAAELPRRRKSSRPHVATLYRWAQRGLRGVKLETIQIGGTCCTSREALQRFFDALTRSERNAKLDPRTPPDRERDRRIEDAEAECDQAGI